jgi:hypothetical protein
MGTGITTVAGNTAAAIQLGDIGFGISAIDVSGASVVGGGTGTATRTDTIVNTVTTGPNFNYTTATTTTGRMTFPATLHDITAATMLLSGDRISASGDNSSTDNFLGVSLKFGYAGILYSRRLHLRRHTDDRLQRLTMRAAAGAGAMVPA